MIKTSCVNEPSRPSSRLAESELRELTYVYENKCKYKYSCEYEYLHNYLNR